MSRTGLLVAAGMMLVVAPAKLAHSNVARPGATRASAVHSDFTHPTARITPNAQAPSSAPNDSLIASALKTRGLVLADWIKPSRLTGDFDGDGKTDVALLVASAKTKKRGLLIVHGGRTKPAVAGAGVDFGNGGDDFEWADRWSVNKRKGKPDALLVVREESGGGLVEFVAGKYRWRQHGD